jgi:hypothetical protein
MAMNKPEAIGHGIDMVGWVAIILIGSGFVSVSAIGLIEWIGRVWRAGHP